MRLSILFLFISFVASAQMDPKIMEPIMEPIHQLFEGMKKGDSALVHGAFHPSAKLYTVYMDVKKNTPVLRGDVFKEFLKSIGTKHKDVWNEFIWAPKIEIDGNLAQVWAPYAFYAGKTFSHCGVDAFQLFRDASGKWKIFHLADTHQKEGCTIPPEVSDKMK